MKITVYTINDCKFSQAEKEYLKKNSLDFEEKNLESNRDFLTEMLAISNNFAGTPVTQIEKDNGEKIVLKGFTPEEFDKALNITSVAVAASDAAQPVAEQAAQPQEQVPAPTDSVATEPAPAPEQAQTPEVPAPTTATQAPAEPVVIESLSEDTSQVTPAETTEPPMPPISTEPVTDAMPEQSAPQIQDAPMQTPPESTPPQEVGPISLDVSPNQQPAVTPEPTPSPEPTPMQAPQLDQTVPPVADQHTQPMDTVPQQQGNPLDSVLQNLQSQVGEATPKKEDGQPPQQ